MPERLSALDASFWFMESATTPMHVGNIGVFRAPKEGFALPRLLALINQRIAFVPRYRKRIREVPLQVGRPLWIDDDDFDLDYHVRRLVLPKPGSRAQLDELAGRLMSRPLDRTKPLWEMYLVDGLEDDTFAIVTKTHQAMIDGLMGIDISQVILDETEKTALLPEVGNWRPSTEPTDLELITAAISESIVHPGVALELARSAVAEVASVAQGLGRKSLGAVGNVVSFARIAAEPSANVTSLNITIGPERRLATADVDLAEFKNIRRRLGGSVNDIALAVIAGALRSWLIGRGEPISTRSQLRVVVPISTIIRADGPDGAGTDGVGPDGVGPVSACLVDLPIGEADPVVRLRHVSYQLAEFQDVSQVVGAETLINMAGYAPPTLHALGARLASNLSSRLYNLAVVNVPGPQHPMYVAGARLLRSYPVMPLPQNQSLCICLTSYDGQVFFGISADRESVPDLDDLRICLEQARAEMTEAANVRGDRDGISVRGDRDGIVTKARWQEA